MFLWCWVHLSDGSWVCVCVCVCVCVSLCMCDSLWERERERWASVVQSQLSKLLCIIIRAWESKRVCVVLASRTYANVCIRMFLILQCMRACMLCVCVLKCPCGRARNTAGGKIWHWSLACSLRGSAATHTHTRPRDTLWFAPSRLKCKTQSLTAYD